MAVSIPENPLYIRRQSLPLFTEVPRETVWKIAKGSPEGDIW
jgi:hypothetical protein